jgi:hypothetical protein
MFYNYRFTDRGMRPDQLFKENYISIYTYLYILIYMILHIISFHVIYRIKRK